MSEGRTGYILRVTVMFTLLQCQTVVFGISSVTDCALTLVKCQIVGLGISSVTDCGFYVCEVPEGRTMYSLRH